MPSIYHIPQPITAYAASSSTVTSNPFLVQDYNTISVSVVSNTTILSLVVQGSNDDGLQPVGSLNDAIVLHFQVHAHHIPNARFIIYQQNSHISLVKRFLFH